MSRISPTSAWLLVLALGGGFLDAISYLGIGKVFTANMTGNTVLLGVALARHAGADAARSGVALGGFCVGVLVGVALITHDRATWPGRARITLAAELLALTAVLALWAVLGLDSLRLVLIAIAGIAMGLQSAAVRASDVRGVNTTYMTSTLLNALARLVQRARPTAESTDSPSLPGAAWAAYGAGAVAGAFAVEAWQAAAVAVPLAIVAAITAAAVRQRGRRS